MLEIGRYNDLKVIKQVDFGFYLDAYDYGEVLLPKRYAADDLQIGDSLTVIVYLDGDERLIATTERPIAQCGEFSYLEVSEINDFGAFCEWGLKKQLFVPFAEQKEPMQAGKKYLVHIFLDERTERILGSTKIYKFLDQSMPLLKEGQEIDGIVCSVTDMAYKVIINHTVTGLLYRNEVFSDLQIGDSVKAFVKKIREDFKIDLTLHKQSSERWDEYSSIILDKLKSSPSQFIKIGDHSAPEVIYQHFGISKKNFKKALGKLYKDRLILIHDDGIQLLD